MKDLKKILKEAQKAIDDCKIVTVTDYCIDNKTEQKYSWTVDTTVSKLIDCFVLSPLNELTSIKNYTYVKKDGSDLKLSDRIDSFYSLFINYLGATGIEYKLVFKA